MINQSVVGYVRVSTNEQFTHGGSIQAQKNLITQFCKEQNFHLEHIFSEQTHVSTRVPMAHRQEGAKVVQLMNDNKNSTGLVLAKLDRAFRSTAEAITHINNWSSKKSIYILDFLNGQKFDSNDPMMKVMLSFMSVFAELERDTIAKRVKVVLKDKKENLESYCGKVYGYARQEDSSQLVPIDIEMEALHHIFRLSSKGLGLRKICTFLNENNYPTGTRGKQWYPSTVSYMLSNTLYKKIADQYFAAKSV